MPLTFYIRNKDDNDQWWSRAEGWVIRNRRTVYTKAEHANADMPASGELMVVLKYQRTPRAVQEAELRKFYHKEGWRASEIAMHLGTMSEKKMLDLYKKMLIAGLVEEYNPRETTGD